MSDIIQLLPDSVANQIAAGEVIQRPASVVKELVENALDAGATEIIIHIKDAGKTLVQISDNGCGMSPTDARMAFERHATSKISSASDLFCIRTMGFRGEALASIAAIADVELRTKKTEDEVGTLFHIIGSEVKTQEPVACNNGTSFMVKNLFFNVPARRKFLKANTTELKHIIYEIQRIAIPNPEIKFSLFHNNSPLYELPKSNYRKRIVDVFGKSISQNLVTVEEQTSLLNIFGFVGQPKYARKTMGEQFFFVNGRFMRHHYFHRAVMQAYEKLLPPETFPSYFLFIEIDPANIDINVHPTKTEIKFENDRAIWQIIHASVRESLGKHNVVPSIDFDQSGNINIPVPQKQGDNIIFPDIQINPEYNPFNEQKPETFGGSFTKPSPSEKKNLERWEDLYEGTQLKLKPEEQNTGDFYRNVDLDTQSPGQFSRKKVLQLKQRYILTPVKSGLMVIDQKRAHERILFEKFMEVLKSESVASQQQLFPQTIELNPADSALLENILPDLLSLGFDIREFGKNTFIINGTPGVLDVSSPELIVEKLLEEYKNSPVDARSKAKEQVAISLAKASALDYGSELKPEEIDHLIDNLFACSTPNFSPDGKRVLTIIPLGDIEKSFSK
ncbi:MAG: DNA mismatch repair endonuclease MutL [Prolixibacteraceae bacterium]|nr:DNA mismatch repair endonuclease MutL [Prolixibacteraceae bacterium]MBT6005482.1 DNA mismatch repair endonuclease MutL [Prolixibacteraceae bacterium]MBT6997009.1 DNA mismatch repair endonuclease MutL [Prolixibacteraceae bacterium]MBT7396695.1 DNA mismatch repair endonuclease MutL [Prolixibacteraceae bacterium]